jgi:hypothetical protein
MRNLLRVLAIVVVFLAVGAAGARAARADLVGCVIYKDRQFAGHQLKIKPNGRIAVLERDWDDAISSVEVAPGCLLIAFLRKDFLGLTESFGPGQWPELPAAWDEQISSLQCNCL